MTVHSVIWAAPSSFGGHDISIMVGQALMIRAKCRQLAGVLWNRDRNLVLPLHATH
jgi:hypothetical protein